jgi:nucleotide-binding universal stress UspA family protein
MMMKTIVALVDFTDVTSRVVKMAESLAGAMRSHMILLHVVPPEPVVSTLGAEAPAIPQPPSPETMEAEKAKLQELQESLTSRGLNVTALQFEGPVSETVIDETMKLNADLVVMGSHHHSALYNLFIGSVTADVLKRLSLPVLVVPADVPVGDEVPVTRGNLTPEEVRQRQAVMQPVLSA